MRRRLTALLKALHGLRLMSMGSFPDGGYLSSQPKEHSEERGVERLHCNSPTSQHPLLQ